jgi:hypothetical protein
MRGSSIKVKNYVKNIDLVDSQVDLRGKLLKLIMVSFGVFSLLYIFVVGSMVFNIVARKSFDVEFKEVSNQVALLESNYVELSSGINKEYSALLGFEETNPVFTARTSAKFVLQENMRNLSLNEI